MNHLLAKNYIAEAAIAAYRIVKMGSADGQVVQAAAAGDLLIGVQNEIAPAINERTDILHVGIADVQLGVGGITRGQEITSDAVGKGVFCNPGAAANAHYIGFALASGAADDIVPMLIAPGVKQG